MSLPGPMQEQLCFLFETAPRSHWGQAQQGYGVQVLVYYMLVQRGAEHMLPSRDSCPEITVH